jgi:hypothetical protein
MPYKESKFDKRMGFVLAAGTIKGTNRDVRSINGMDKPC